MTKVDLKNKGSKAVTGAYISKNMNQRKLEKKTQVLFLLIGLSLLSSIVFLIYGLNFDNPMYALKRRAVQIFAILIASYCTGYSAVSFQTISNNQILTPSVMGLENLYRFIQTFIVFLFGLEASAGINIYLEFLISLFVMVFSVYLIFQLLLKEIKGNIFYVVLVGIILGTFFSGLSSFMTMVLDPNEYIGLQERLFASVNSVNKELLYLAFVITAVLFFINLRSDASLDVCHLGRNNAISLGLDYDLIMKRTLLKIALLVSLSVCLIGPISFLSIVAVSLARRVIKTYEHRYFIAAASLISFLFLTVGSFVLKNILNYATQLSVMINFFGGLYFLFLVLKQTDLVPRTWTKKIWRLSKNLFSFRRKVRG